MDYTEILIKIRRIIRSMNLESKKIQKEHGVSIPQVLCLNYLNNCTDYQSTHKEIRNYLNLNSSTVTGIIDRLEKKGLVARLPKKEDKRTTYIALTSIGAKLLDKIPALLHERLSVKLEKLPENKIDELNQSLDMLIHYLDITDIEASPMITIEDDLGK
jgi:DNA-binding MarR family transcriptional regulator